jgi:mRNA interferase RelE/StbE
MSFELEFLEEALLEWKRLHGSVRDQFRKKLAERLTEPRIPSAKLFGHPDRYKIKLRTIGYRLVYEVLDKRLIVLVIAVGRRDRNAVYRATEKR